MKKRIFAVILSFSIAIAPLQITQAKEESPTGNEIVMTKEDSFTIEDGILMKYTGTDSEVTIPNGVTKINEEAFLENKVIEKVNFPDSVTEIGTKAFYGCSKLKEVTLPENLTTLGYAAFVNCSSLQYVMWPKTLKNVVTLDPVDKQTSLSPFSNTGQGLRVEFEDGTTEIPMCFFEVANLEYVTIPDSVEKIAYYTFVETGLKEISLPVLLDECYPALHGCPLESITLAEGTQKIYGLMFQDTDITELTLPDSVEIIDNRAFAECEKLETIKWPANLTTIGTYAFSNCTALKEVDLPDKLEFIEEGAFSKTGIEEITIPDTVTAIGGNAFANCKNLKKIVIPDSVTTIGEGILDGCSEVVVVCSEESKAYEYAVANGIETLIQEKPEFEIQDGILKCYNGTDSQVVIPDGVTKIGDQAFYKNQNIVSVQFPDSVTEIGMKAFYDCNKLEKVQLPKHLEKLGFSAFVDCDSLQYVWLPKTLNQIVTEYYNEEKKLYEWYTPFQDTAEGLCAEFEEGTKSIPASCFSETKNLKEVIIPDTVTSIGAIAFAHTGLKEVYVPALEEGLETSEIFMGCPLEKIVLAEGIKEIYPMMFADTSITSLQLPSSVKRVDTSAFAECEQLQTIKWSESLEEIGLAAFNECTSLKEVKLPEGLKKIEAAAFDNCTGLTDLYLPASVSQVGEYIEEDGVQYYRSSFQGCTSLKNVTFGEGTLKIEKHLLEKTGIEEIVVPDTVTEIGEYAFSNCADLKKIVIPDSVTVIGEGILDQSSNAVIYCNEGSAAYQYAIAKGLKYQAEHIHQFGEWFVEKEATCTEDGLKKRECECGEYETEKISMLGHSLGEWETEVVATYFQEGKKIRKCQRCAYQEEEVIPKLDPDLEEHPDYSLAELQVVDALSLEPISEAVIQISNDQERNTVKTDQNGKATIFVPAGKYYFQVEKTDYLVRGFEYNLEAGKMTLPQIGISKESVVKGNLTVTEMSEEEIKEAGIDPNAEGNNHVFKYEVELRFEDGVEIYDIPFITIKNEDGDELKEYVGDLPEGLEVETSDDGKEITITGSNASGIPMQKVKFLKITDYMYIVIQGEVKWLKEMFHVQLVVVNQSKTDEMKNCVANLELPDGLSLADLISGAQSSEIDVGTVGKEETRTIDWYIRGDTPGDYNISASLKGEFSLGDEFDYTYETTEPFHVYAGTDMKLTVHLADSAYYNEPYTMIFELENVSGRSIYNVHHKIEKVGQYVKYTWVEDGRVLDDEKSFEELKAETLGDKTEISRDEFKPGEKLAILIKTDILWKSPLQQLKEDAALMKNILQVTGVGKPFSTALGLLAYMDVKYYLSDTLSTMLEGSTAEIPIEFDIESGDSISLGDKVLEEMAEKLWGKAKNKGLKFIFGDDFSEYRNGISLLKKLKTKFFVEPSDMNTEWTAWVETEDGQKDVISISMDGVTADNEGKLSFHGEGEISVEALNTGEAYLIVQDKNGNKESYHFAVEEMFPGQETIASDLKDLMNLKDLILVQGSTVTKEYLDSLQMLGLDIFYQDTSLKEGDVIPTGSVIKDQDGETEYTVMVPGDTNSDARINLFDIYQILFHANQQLTMTEVQQRAGDYTGDQNSDQKDAEYLLNYLTDTEINARAMRMASGSEYRIDLADIVGKYQNVLGVQIDISGLAEQGINVTDTSLSTDADFSRAVYNRDGDYIRAISSNYEDILELQNGQLIVMCDKEEEQITIPGKVYIQTKNDTVETEMNLTFKRTVDESEDTVEKKKEELLIQIEEYEQQIKNSNLSQKLKEQYLQILKDMKSEVNGAGDIAVLNNLKEQIQNTYEQYQRETENSKTEGTDNSQGAADDGESEHTDQSVTEGKATQKAAETSDVSGAGLWLTLMCGALCIICLKKRKDI